MAAGTVFIDLTLDDKKFKVGLDVAKVNVDKFAKETQAKVDSLASSLYNKMNKGWIGMTAAVSAAVYAVKSCTDALIETERANIQLNNVIRSTAGAAGMSAEAVKGLTASLSENSNYTKTAVLNSANLLLTFTNIGKDVFPKATQAVLDMSTAMGTDLRSSSLQIGKALQDPVTGMTALRRVGVQLTEELQQQIKVLMEYGDVAGAQAIILKELNTEFGGSAKAQMQGYEGTIAQLTKQFSELKKVVALFILEDLNLKSGIQGVTETLKDYLGVIKEILSVAKLIPDGGISGGLIGYKIGKNFGPWGAAAGTAVGAGVGVTGMDLYKETKKGKELSTQMQAGEGASPEFIRAALRGETYTPKSTSDYNNNTANYTPSIASMMLANGASIKTDVENEISKLKNTSGALNTSKVPESLLKMQQELADKAMSLSGTPLAKEQFRIKKEYLANQDEINKLPLKQEDKDKLLKQALSNRNIELGKLGSNFEPVLNVMDSVNKKVLEINQGGTEYEQTQFKIVMQCDEWKKKIEETGISGDGLAQALARVDLAQQKLLDNAKQLYTYQQLQKADAEAMAAINKRGDVYNSAIASGKSKENIDKLYEDAKERFGNKDMQDEYVQDQLTNTKDTTASLLGSIGNIASSIQGSMGGKGGNSYGLSKLDKIINKDTINALMGKSEKPKTPATTGDYAAMGLGVAASGVDAYAQAKQQGVSRGQGAAQGAASGAMSGALTAAGGMMMIPGFGWVAAAITVVAAAIIGAAGGALGGGKGKKPPSAEELEAKKLSNEQRQLSTHGFLPTWSKSEMKKDLPYYKEYMERLKNLDKTISEAVAKGLEAGFKQPSTTAAVEEFNKSFSASFSNIFISQASSTLEKLMKFTIAPITQVVEDMLVIIQKNAGEVLKPYSDKIVGIYKAGLKVIDVGFDILNLGLGALIKKMPILGSTVAATIYATIIAAVPALYAVLSDVIATLGKLIEKMFEGTIKILSDAVLKFQIAFDIQPDWIKELKNAGITIDMNMGSDAVKGMQSMWSSFKSFIADALSEGLKAGTASAGYQIFGRRFKEGFYKWVVEGLVGAIAAGMVALAAVAPYIKDWINVIVNAVKTGIVDWDAVNNLLTNMVTGAEKVVVESEGLFTNMFDLLDNFHDKLFGIDKDGTGTGTEPPDTSIDMGDALTGWEKASEIITGWVEGTGKIIAALLVAVQPLVNSIQYLFSELIGWFSRIISFIFNFGYRQNDGYPKWYTDIQNIVTGFFKCLDFIAQITWNIITMPLWYDLITGTINFFKGLIVGIVNFFFPPTPTTPSWYTIIKAGVDFFKGLFDGITAKTVTPPATPSWYTVIGNVVEGFKTLISNVINFFIPDNSKTKPSWYTAVNNALNAVFGWLGDIWNFVADIVKSAIVSLEKVLNIDISGNKIIGSYATGTDYVPRTGTYQLHQGEAVLTKDENSKSRLSTKSGQVINFNFNGLVIREDADIDLIVDKVGYKIAQMNRI